MKTLVNTSILRYMTRNLSFVDQYALEHVYNQGRSEVTWIFSMLFSVAILSLTIIPFGQYHVPAVIVGIVFGLPMICISVRIAMDTDRRTTMFRGLRNKVYRLEKALNLGDTSTQRDDEIVGKVRRALVEFTKPIVVIHARIKELDEFLKSRQGASCAERLDYNLSIKEFDKSVTELKGQLGTFLDRAKECLGDMIDNGHGFTQFFRQAEAELKS
jgi:hypothetical protein